MKNRLHKNKNELIITHPKAIQDCFFIETDLEKITIT